MTEQPAKLSKKDLKFLMSLLDKAEEETDHMIEMGGDNKKAASLRRRQIMRIRLALTDLDKQMFKRNESNVNGVKNKSTPRPGLVLYDETVIIKPYDKRRKAWILELQKSKQTILLRSSGLIVGFEL
jgi:hypothetical protein